MTHNWNDLRFFLAIYERKSLVGASTALKVDETTVGRRLAALEGELGVRLFERKKSGYTLTPAGLKVLQAALPIQEQLLGLRNQIEGSDQSLKGVVRLTCPESIASLLIIPKLSEHFTRFPDLKIEFITGSHTVNVSKREADIAIRMFKPVTGALYARKLGKLRFAWYGSRDLPESRKETFIDYPDSDATAAEAKSLKKFRNRFQTRLQVNSRASILSAIRAGLGFGMLPELMTDSESGLVQRQEFEPIDLDVWMVVHSDLKTNARVRVTSDFLRSLISPRLR